MDELSANDCQYHDKLLEAVKAQVKAIMEESVTKKFVHEESEHVLRLCASIQTCLLHHLRKRTAGFLRTNKIANLFNKIGKSIPEVARLVVKIEEVESAIEDEISQEGKTVTVNGMRPQTLQLRQLKQVWVRLALTEKLLDRILEFLADNWSKFYEKNAILADPVRGRILSSLLVGPCALEYTKMKTSDHYWSDPPADELLQRHKLHCRDDTSSPSRRPTLHSTSKYGSSEPAEKNSNGNYAGNTFREYVESLHQNSKSTLLYGKNNVVVQPREEVNPIHGYLSLHQVIESLYIKWTPNQLMNINEHRKTVNCDQDQGLDEGTNQEAQCTRPPLLPESIEQESCPKQRSGSFLSRNQPLEKPKKVLSYWEYAINVNVQDVVYLHCHQRNDAGGTLVLVGQDGVQRPPICFPPGGHLLAFLTCLETGLLPHGHLDPPLWSQHGKGKVFPRLRKRSSRSSSSSAGSQSEAEEATDFVFRVTTGKSKTIYREPVIEVKPIQECFDAYSIGPGYSCYNSQESKSYSSRSSLKVLCDTMRRQIISRAFYGWLAHCRHLSTVRTHLSALVLQNHCQLPVEPLKAIDKEAWDSFLKDGQVSNPDELMRRVYLGGIDHSMRNTIWPFLLNHYPLDSTVRERENLDVECADDHKKVLKEWGVVERIIKRKEKGTLAAKLSSDSRTSSFSSLDGSPKQYTAVLRKQSTTSDVFASLEHDSSSQTTHPLGTVSDANENIDGNFNYVEENDRFEVDDSNVGGGKENGGADDVVNKRQILRDKFKSNHLSNDPQSHTTHTPYSSISTEPSGNDRRFSNVTTMSMSLDTTPMSIEEEDLKLENILESERENAASNGSGGSDSDSKSSNKKVLMLKKQNGIDMENSIDHGKIEDEEDEVEDAEAEADLSIANYSAEVLDNFALNLHRIEKDVHRCDRNHDYFAVTANLNKLRNIMCSYVWRHLDTGYMQGMCDLAAPLLLVMDDESKVYSCFTQLMKRMANNFPNGGAMDSHFADMRSLIQVLDAELFEHMHRNGDYTHFYFCYRWFLLDFKRELSYENDVFAVWECIWAARHTCSEHFGLFFALALLHKYRDIILDNEMDFTDIIKFFNEMAERHDASRILKLAQHFVYEVQSMISK